jgi:hypothetical protein
LFVWDESNNNTIHSNEIVYNNVEVDFHSTFQNSSGNRFYHNNFTDNIQQVYIHPSCPPSIWDNGYPSGGNRWNDYLGPDQYSGPFQNLTGSDGIGDTPYIIDANNTDNYPLMPVYTPMPWDITGPTMWMPDWKCDIRDVHLLHCFLVLKKEMADMMLEQTSLVLNTL